MSIYYRIDGQKGITYVVWTGLVTADEFVAHARRLMADADWPPYRRLQIIDMLSASADESLDQEVLLKVARIYSEHVDQFSNAKAAVIASEIFMKATIFRSMMASTLLSMIVFNSLETACKWLGIDAAETWDVLQELRAQNPDQSNL